MVKLLQCTKRMRTIESVEDLQRFSWEEVRHEASDLCPDLVTLLDQLLQQVIASIKYYANIRHNENMYKSNLVSKPEVVGSNPTSNFLC